MFLQLVHTFRITNEWKETEVHPVAALEDWHGPDINNLEAWDGLVGLENEVKDVEEDESVWTEAKW